MELFPGIIEDDGNRDAVARIAALSSASADPVRLVVSGPAGAGKTTLFQAAAREMGRLSESSGTRRTALFTHAAELTTAIMIGENEKLLERAGSDDVLFIDAIDDFFGHVEIGPQTFRLLVAERTRVGLDTVVGARLPLGSYDRDAIDDVLKGFDEVAIRPLGGVGRVAFAKRVLDGCGAPGERPELSDGALSFIANDFADGLDDVRNAVRFFATAAGFSPGEEIDVSKARAALER